MNWTELIKNEVETTYKVTEGLLALVDEDGLDWKPGTGSNWMTVGQLIMHQTNACGAAMRGFVTGDWGMPDVGEMTEEEMLPPAEKLPVASSVAEAKTLLTKDKQLALEMLSQCSEERLANEISTAPWDPTERVLGYQLLEMVAHLHQHKGQLFYYLKLQGQQVHTGHLWGM
jgi:uncharacterized damage-inducible protein DinB